MSALSDLLLTQGGDHPPNGLSRGERGRPGTVYFAFKPEAGVIDHVVSIGDRLRAKHRLTGTVSASVLHVTICSIGNLPDLPDERIDAARKIAGNLVAKPFEIILDRVRTYPNGKEKLPLVAFAGTGDPKAGLFRHALVADLRRGGFIFPKKLPDPHMTLFYDHNVVAEEPIEPIRWIVRDFMLVHSIKGKGRHDLLDRWPLGG